MTRLTKRVLLAAVVLAALGGVAVAMATTKPEGSLTQISGRDGCYTADGSSEDTTGACRDIRGGTTSASLAFSPDHRFAYLTSYGDFTTVPPVLSIFHLHKNGSLTQLHGKQGCISVDGSSADGADTCSKARTLDTPDGPPPAISSDGRFVYLAGQDSGPSDFEGIAVFKRNLKTGTLHQLKGKNGCVDADGSFGCAKALEVDDVGGVYLSPDERFVYAANYDGEPTAGIAVFRRDPHDGSLKQLHGRNACITQDGTSATTGTQHPCRSGYAVGQSQTLVLPDNHFVYTASEDNAAIAALRRNSKGGLRQLSGKAGCISDTGDIPASSKACRKGKGLNDIWQMAASKGGRFIYAAGYDGSLPTAAAVVEREKDGSLTQSPGKGACVSRDGSSVDGPDTCQDGRDLDGSYVMGISHDGRTLYVPQFNASAVLVFRVSPTKPTLKQLPGQAGCVSLDGSSDDGVGTCVDGRVLDGAYQAAVGPGNNLYVPGSNNNGLTRLHAKP